VVGKLISLSIQREATHSGIGREFSELSLRFSIRAFDMGWDFLSFGVPSKKLDQAERYCSSERDAVFIPSSRGSSIVCNCSAGENRRPDVVSNTSRIL